MGIIMTDEGFKHYIIQRVIPELKEEGFDTSLESDGEDDYVTLTIRRWHRYY